MNFKLIFFGTPQISLAYLKQLYEQETVVAVVTQPDRNSGRGQKIHSSSVKSFAVSHNIPVLQPVKLTDAEFVSQLNSYAPDLGFIVAYGKILTTSVINSFRLGCINLHFSLLPKYRGPAPVQRAIINGETVTGITLFWIVGKEVIPPIDTGKIILQTVVPVDSTDTAVSLQDKMVVPGLDLLTRGIDLIKTNPTVGYEQTGVVTLAPLLTKSDGRINWTRPAGEIHNLVRGTQPWPGAWSCLKKEDGRGEKGEGEKIIKIYSSRIVNITEKEFTEQITKIQNTTPTDFSPYQGGDIEGVNIPPFDNILPGTVVKIVAGEGIIIRCGNNPEDNQPTWLLITQMQEEGKKVLPADIYARGARLVLGGRFINDLC